MASRDHPKLARAARIGGTIALLLALFIAFVLVTPFGLTLTLRVLLGALHGAVLAGHISFGDVDGGLLTGFRIEDVEIDDGRGEPLARAAALEVDLSVRALWQGRVEVERLRLETPRIWVDTSTPGTGWSTLAAPSDASKPPSTGPGSIGPPFPLSASMSVEDGTVLFVDRAGAEPQERIQALEFDAFARYSAPAWRFEIGSLRARADGHPLQLAAEARMTPDVLVVSKAAATLAGAETEASARIELGGGLSALAEAQVPPGWPLLPAGLLPRGGRTRVDATIDSDGRIRGATTLESDQTQVGARVDFSPADRTAELNVDVEPLALREVAASAPEGTLRGSARAALGWGELSDLTSINGRLQTSLAGDFAAGPGFEGLTAEARLRGGRADAELRVDMPRAQLDLRARGRVAPRLEPELVVLTATVPEISALIPGDPGVRGAVQLGLRGTGRRGRWQAQLTADGADFRAGPWSSQGLRLTATATGTRLEVEQASAEVVTTHNEVGPQTVSRVTLRAQRPEPRRFDFDLDAREGEPIEALRLRGSVTATTGVQVAIEDGAIELAQATWDIAPFTAHFEEGRLDWRGLEAVSELGFIESTGQLRAKPRRGSVELRAQIDDLSSIPFVPLQGGSLGVSTQLEWDAAAIAGRLDARAEGVLAGPTPRPISADLQVEADDLVQARLRMRVPEGGEVEVSAQVAPPTPWTDGPAWLKWNRLRSANVKLDEISVAAWLEDDANTDGRLNGEVRYDRSDRNLDVSLAARNVQAPGVEVPLEFTIEGGIEDDASSLSVESEIGNAPALRVRGRAGVGREELPRIDELDFRERDWDVQGELPPLPLSLVARAAGLPKTWVETATGSVSLSFAASSQPRWRAHLAARANGEIRAGAPVLDAAVDVDLEAGRLAATASVTGEGLGQIRAAYRVEADGEASALERWNRGRFEANLGQVALTGVRSMVVLPASLRGRVDGHAVWNLETDEGSVEIEAPDLTVADALAALDVDVSSTWTSTGTRAQLRLVPHGAASGLQAQASLGAGPLDVLGGSKSVRLQGSWQISGLDAGTLIRDELDRERFGGRLSSTGTIAGALDAPQIAGDLRWQDARVGRQSFDRFRASGEVSPQQTRAQLDLRESGGGRLGVRVGGGAGDGEEAKGSGERGLHITASEFSIDFFSELASMATGATAQIEGLMSADLHITDADGPQLNGDLTLRDVEIALPGTVPRVNDAKVEVTTSGRNVDVSLKGRSGARGRLRLNSQIDLSDFDAPVVTGEVTGRRVEFLAGPLPLEINFGMNLKGRPKDRHYALDVDIRDTTIVVTERDIESNYAPIRSTPDVVQVETFGVRPIEAANTRPAVANDPLQMVVRVRNSDPINFRGKDAQGVIEIDTRVDVRSASTRISGTAQVTDGIIALFGRDYRVVQAVVRFTERSPPNPQLDVQLTHAFDTLTLTVIVTGRAQNPNVRFTSDPGTYDESQLLSYFAGLSSPDQEGPSGSAGQQAAGAAAGLLLGPVTKEVRKNLPIDTFDVSMGNNAPVVTVGKWLSDELFVAYTWTTRAEPTEDEQSGLIRWRFYPGWVLEVIAGPNQQSADVYWIRRF